MPGETDHLDLKRDFNPDDPCAVVELVKDLVAMANSGGGTIRFGATEHDEAGVDPTLVRRLDGARIGDQVNRHVAPRAVRVSHEVRTLPSGQVVIDLSIGPCGKYPLVFSRQGQCPGLQHPVFRPGDIYVRHGARSDRATYEDMVDFIDRAANASRDEIFRRIDRLARLPEGYELVAALPTGEALASPVTLLDLTLVQRERHVGSLLDGKNLLWCFLQRRDFELTPPRVSLLVRSALRRNPTLFYWLAEYNDPAAVSEILLSTLEDKDRDKSDAKDAILEVAALLTSDADLDAIVTRMRRSEYKHFQDAANAWVDRTTAQEAFRERVERTEWDGTPALDLQEGDILTAAEMLAQRALESNEPVPRVSRQLADLGRVLYVKRCGWR